MIYVITLAHCALSPARGKLKGLGWKREGGRLRKEVALVQDEMRIKHTLAIRAMEMVYQLVGGR